MKIMKNKLQVAGNESTKEFEIFIQEEEIMKKGVDKILTKIAETNLRERINDNEWTIYKDIPSKRDLPLVDIINNSKIILETYDEDEKIINNYIYTFSIME